MVGWFAKKGQNSRIYMCVKDLKWELEAADNIKRATILAMAQYFRNELFDGVELKTDILDHPFDYERNDLFAVYEILETVRNQIEMQIKLTKKNMQNFGMELPQFSIDHAKATGRGLEVWMSTIGAGIAPDQRDEVRVIWSYLSGSLGSIEDALSNLREVERKTAEMTGTFEPGMFNIFDNQEWLKFCSFVPSVFLKKI